MSNVAVSVGLDYHQDSVQVCVLDAKGNQLANATRGNCWREIRDVVPAKARLLADLERVGYLLQRVLIETANRLKWRSEVWCSFSKRMQQRGKAPCVITAAIANRWIRGLYYDMIGLPA